MKYYMLITGLLALLLSACGAKRVATLEPAQARASAVAQAATFVALTLTALPTATLTPLPSPTLETTDIPTAEMTDTPDRSKINCAHSLDVGEAGPTHQYTIRNRTSGRVNLSLYMYKPNAFGQCGSLLFTKLDANESRTADLPAGYYSAYTYGGSTKVSGSFVIQPAQSANRLVICIRSSHVVYTGTC